MPFPFLQAVTDLMRTALADRLDPAVQDYLDLFTDDGVMETPYVRPGSDGRSEGRSAIAARMEALRGVVRLSDFTLMATYPGADSQVVALEYTGTVHLEQKGVRFRQSYVAVLHLRDGRLALWREYTNPLAAEGATPDAG